MRKIISLSVISSLFLMPSMTFAVDLSTAIENARVACSGIDASLSGLKTKAGINTAVTAVGTVSGGVALGTGLAKVGVDKEYDALAAKVKQLIAEKSNIPIERIEVEDPAAFQAELHRIVEEKQKAASAAEKRMNELEEKSKTLGDVRTGTMAVSTATSIAGTAIAATNKVEEDLEENIQKCLSATKELSNARLAAKVENTATDVELATADKIISKCHDYEFVDIKPINKRATGAAIASGIGIGTGVVGTITSAVANSNKIREDDTAQGNQKEKNLNTTANIMAGASTAASATATIFNATQISAIKKVVTVAEACEGALK